MAKNQLIYFTKDIRFKPTNFLLADGTTAKQIFDPSTEGSRITGIVISSTSVTAKTLLLQLNSSGTISKLGHITVPAGAGTNGSVAVVSGLNTGNLPWLLKDANGNPYIDLNYNMNLEAKLLSALSSGESIDVTVAGANFDA